ncbi:single-stranded DNA-binding protein [Streptomyces chattanoogensis]|uniref:single-stranded DNA-binding protein n=1 Tax=Streptomyces chattanoogensis TaxID=66876 RepID=UPI00368375BB
MSGETTITVIGTVHGTPKAARLPAGGKLVVAFGLMRPRREYDHETRLWHDAEPFFLICAAFGKRGEGVRSTLRDGMHVVATGYLTLRDGEGEYPYLHLKAVGVDLGRHSVTVDDADAPLQPSPPTPRPIPPRPALPPSLPAPAVPGHLPSEEPARPTPWWSIAR